MADTPEEVAEADLDSLEQLMADERDAAKKRHTADGPVWRKHWKEVWQRRRQTLFREMRNAMPAMIAIARATQAAEARGFAKGLDVAARVLDARLGRGTGLAARIRALAPQAPPEVAAAEPKP